MNAVVHHLRNRIGLLLIALIATPASLMGQNLASLDTSYTPNPSSSVAAMGLQSDGKLVTGDSFQSYSSGTNMYRFNVDGSTDTSFS